MSKGKSLSTIVTAEASQQSSNEQPNSQPSRGIQRRSFIKGLGVAGAALSAAPLLRVSATAEDHGSISKGDAAILRFVAAAEIIESDIWLQYNELAGVQDGEVSRLASKLIPGYPSHVTGGNPDYTADVKQLDGDMDQYISDNTEDELSHEVFLNAYLAAKGADTVNLDAFRTLPASQASGSYRLVDALPQPAWQSRSWGHVPERHPNARGWPAHGNSQNRRRCRRFRFPASGRQHRGIPLCMD
jgi:hypothetical protein